MTKSALILGYFASQHAGQYRAVCEDIGDRLESLDWEVHRASGYRNRLARMVDVLITSWRVRRHYKVANIEVFSGLAFRQAELSAWFLRRLGKPYVLTLHGGNLPEFSKKHPSRVRQLLASASAVTAPSGYLRDELRHLREDIILVPNAIELADYPFRLRANPTPKLLWLRSIHAIYNPVMAVKVVHLLRQQYPDIHLWMVGPDKGDGTLEEVKHAIAEMGLESHIEIIGGVPKSRVPEWMHKADIFINTTLVDNTPISLIEAMASGLCLVSTDVGGIPALVHDGSDGLLVSPNDAEAMAAAISRILTEPRLAESLSQSAYETSRLFDWDRVLQQWDEILGRNALTS